MPKSRYFELVSHVPKFPRTPTIFSCFDLYVFYNFTLSFIMKRSSNPKLQSQKYLYFFIWIRLSCLLFLNNALCLCPLYKKTKQEIFWMQVHIIEDEQIITLFFFSFLFLWVIQLQPLNINKIRIFSCLN